MHLPSDLAELCREVEADVVRLDSREGQTLSGLGSFLVRSESVASSRIEQVYADLDEVARASVDADASDAARTTAAASAAMLTLLSAVAPGRPLTETLLLEGHRALMADDRLEGTYAGRYRDMQNWVGGSDFSPRGAAHVPPPPERVAGLMTDVIAFAARSDVPPLAQAALTHGQFEAIHPFTDGNGRIGRAVIAMVLRSRGTATSVVIPSASAMLADVDRYFSALAAYRAGDAGVLVRYLAECTAHATAEAAVSATNLRRLGHEWVERVRPRARSSAAALVEGLLVRPVLDIAAAGELTGSTPARTYEALDRLVEHDILREVTGRAKNRVWVAGEVMTEIADLDERIGRRMSPGSAWR
ncbi:Fic family protein [Nocardioidaceae bacterium]|nr:Fic family protein [Nocardioidaceae bacterium]